MTARITKIEKGTAQTTIQVEGSLHIEDAEILEQTYQTLRAETSHIQIDLANLSFLDTESASVLCRLQQLGAELVGLHFFVQRVMEMAQTSVD